MRGLPAAFAALAGPFAEGLLLVSRRGTVIAANEAAARLFQVAASALPGRPLRELVCDAPEAVERWLRVSARSRGFVPGALTMAASGVRCRADGALAEAARGGGDAILVLRLAAHEHATQRFVTLNRRLGELSQEVARRRRAEAEVREQRNTLRVTLASIGDAVVVTDRDATVTFLNPVAEGLTGWPRAEALGRPLREVFRIVNEDTRLEVESPIDRVLREGAVVGLANDTLLLARDGRQIAIDDSAAPIRTDAERLLGVVLVFRDVGDRRRLDRERAELLVRAEAAAELLRRVGRITAAALAATSLDELLDALLVRIRSTLRADSVTILLHDADTGTLRAQAALGVEHEPEWRSRVRIGEGFPGRLAAAGDVRAAQEIERRADGPRSCLGVALLVGDRLLGVLHLNVRGERHFREDEAQLLELAAGRIALAIERAAAHDAERRARIEAEAANRAKDEFLAILSHELRSPLGAIRMWAGVLRAGRADQAVTARAVEAIERNAVSQARLVEDLLDLSSIMSGKLRLEIRPLDLGLIVEQALDAVRAQAAAKGTRIDLTLEPIRRPLRGDPDRLQQVIWNLLSNAVKFSPPGSRVLVRVENGTSQAVVTVRDEGEGIGPAALPHVFERFRQADSSSTRRHGGLGLGLAIVRQLVDMHGGAVEAASEGPGRGATFTVRLPFAADTAPQAAGAPTGDGAGEAVSGVHVLVVDDEADARESAAALLARHGARVTVVGSAEEAVAAVERGLPDVLLSDVAMADVDGYQLMTRLRPRLEEAGVGAVALSAYAAPEDRERALAAGFRCHLAKPVDPHQLVTVIARLARRRPPR